MNFSELKSKDVINIVDGKRLGKPIDVIFNDCACIEALVVPGQKSLMNLIKGVKEGAILPWERVKQIGDDVILVELDTDFCRG